MPWSREQMAERAAEELQDGFYVNLVIRIPTLVANCIPHGVDVTSQGDNGVLGMGTFPCEGEAGAIANWTIPGKMVKGMGGAMDLVAGVKRVIVVMEHTNRGGDTKVFKRCTLPLTGEACVDKVVTDLRVFDLDRPGGGLTLVQLAPKFTLDEVVAKTATDFATDRRLGGRAA